MSQYNKLSDFQYTRFHILDVQLHFELFRSVGISAMMVNMVMTLDCAYLARMETK